MNLANLVPTSSHRMERTPSTSSHSLQPISNHRDASSPSLAPTPIAGASLSSQSPSSSPTQAASTATGPVPAPPGRPAGFLLPIDVSSRFGARLRELRRERNLTQLKMATDFGIDRSFISDVERGRKSISLPMLEVIALGMKMSLSELLQNI